MKEGKTPAPEPQRPSADILTKQLPAGLLGLEIPPDVRDVLKVGEGKLLYLPPLYLFVKPPWIYHPQGMTASAHSSTTAESLDSKPLTSDYQPPISASSISTLMPKTVDYGHGHGMDSM